MPPLSPPSAFGVRRAPRFHSCFNPAVEKNFPSKMETTPLNIPGQFKRSQSTQLSSLVLSSSYFCASSLHHPRNSGVTFSVPVNDDPSMERKLSRTRQMSETTRMSGAAQRSSSRRMTTIPTVKEDINPQVLSYLSLAQIGQY